MKLSKEAKIDELRRNRKACIRLVLDTKKSVPSHIETSSIFDASGRFEAHKHRGVVAHLVNRQISVSSKNMFVFMSQMAKKTGNRLTVNDVGQLKVLDHGPTSEIVYHIAALRERENERI